MSTLDIVINGQLVAAGLLEARPMRRCRVEECQSYCCTGGVYVSVEHAADVLAHQALIAPHLPEDRRDPSLWFDGSETLDEDHPAGGLMTGTRVLPDPSHPVGEGCVFLRPDRRCALQAAGIAAGEHPWRFKPFYCAFHPLMYEKRRIILTETSEMYLEGGSCNRPTEPAIPLYELFDEELTLALGAAGYAELKTLAAARRAD